MAKLHKAQSEFFDPILSLVDGVHLVAPYALPKLIGSRANLLIPGQSKLPWLWDGRRWLTLADHRTDFYGSGGKFATIDVFGRDCFPEWKGYLICPIQK